MNAPSVAIELPVTDRLDCGPPTLPDPDLYYPESAKDCALFPLVCGRGEVCRGCGDGKAGAS